MDKRNFTYENSNLYNSLGKAVMMEWERDWMKKSAEIVCKNGGNILNIGHGLGLVDSYIQEHNIKSHTIIESHPDVHSHMKKMGWYERANVIESDWQSVIHKLPTYDGIYFDTWDDSWDDFKNGLLRHLPHILNKNGIFSFWMRENTEDLVLNEYCKENNFNIDYEIFNINIPTEQHKKGGTYIDPSLDYVLLPIITNLNNPIPHKQNIF